MSASALWPLPAQVTHLPVSVSKLLVRAMREFMLQTTLVRKTRASPDTVNEPCPTDSFLTGLGLSCRKHDAALLAALTTL